MKTTKAILFWLLSLTWGLPMTIVGALAAFGLLITGHKPKAHHFLVYFEVGEGWGGVNFGPIFVVCRDNDPSIKPHEAGHGLQNIMFGPLMPFIVAIPSAVRYWYREYLVQVKKVSYWALPDYDEIWFEGQATRFGEKYFK